MAQLISQLTDFQYLLMVATLDMEVHDLLKNAFRFFTHSEVIFSLDPPQIIVGPIEEKHIITEEKFYDF